MGLISWIAFILRRTGDNSMKRKDYSIPVCIGFETDRPGDVYMKHQCIDGSKGERQERVRLFQKIAGDEGGCLLCQVVGYGSWGRGPQCPPSPPGATAPHGSAIALRSGEPGPQCEMGRV